MSMKVLSVIASVCVLHQRTAVKKTNIFFTSFLLMILLVLAPTWMCMWFLIAVLLDAVDLFVCLRPKAQCRECQTGRLSKNVCVQCSAVPLTFSSLCRLPQVTQL